ncbi:MAG: tRNA uridine-5-carboxymethylaminomethyl(34) synthesis enzyme MnmG [Christensenellaceae bacterium]|jgi:tRNA uridine 5-carboxymethylaminomethyl modification enzyme|nr:tRNA uridine-5-carboxymethylaminomethyl(34) synthesis enzyme MnmG [Christensenellaceae bacterium]
MFYDVIIIGAGHAGCEAANAAAKVLGDKVEICSSQKKVAVITLDKKNIGHCPCNPSIGGTAKGHLVCEIDALGGIMGLIADKATIQMRCLNESKGAAVAAFRAQIDKDVYHKEMLKYLNGIKNLDTIEDEAVTISMTKNVDDDKNSVYREHNKHYIWEIGLKSGKMLKCTAIILATGVYLRSKTFVGSIIKNEGPTGFPSANCLSSSLQQLGLSIRRFKTGTPARIDKRSIDYSKTEMQYGDANVRKFSFIKEGEKNEKARLSPAALTYTNLETHKIIRENIKLSAVYSGLIEGTGPRYCPSIEDKVMRFADRERHQTFLEQETLDGNSIYLQGLSTSLPAEIQERFIHSINGLQNAEILKNGYAIEYDCIDSLQLYPTLQYKKYDGLYFAGQINGTSGYEEAAAQGLLAGINAALFCLEQRQLILSRTDSYIGVLTDDLTTKGTNEPYRMFSARAEHRLFLRQDNADQRLTPIGRKIGLVDDERWRIFTNKMKLLDQLKNSKEKEFIGDIPQYIVGIANIENTYSGYLRREKNLIERVKSQESTPLPADLDYSKIKGLRHEASIKLDAVKPLNIGQASRIAGVNPADITVLLIYLSLERKRKA